MKIILFDIDQTLLHTGGAGRIAFEKAIEELFGVPDAWQGFVPDGRTDPAIVLELLSRALKRRPTAEECAKLSKRYLECFHVEMRNPPNFRLMPGVTELLQALNRPDILLGVATGNFEDAAWAKLERGGLRDFFKFGGFASDSPERFELTRQAVERGRKMAGKTIESKSIYLVGDTPHDIFAGREAGVVTVGVATGRTTAADFQACSPDFVLSDLKDIAAFFQILENR